MKRFVQPLAFIAALLGVFVLFQGQSLALSGSDFKPGRIIDDVVFTNQNSMSTIDIQRFLESKVVGGSCDTDGSRASTRYNSSMNRYYTHAEWGAQNGNPAPYVCLTTYRENSTTKQTNLGNPGALHAGDGSQSAAEIILAASQQYNINPETLLVLLQKEQSLISDDWPWAIQYQSATGAYCPDTASCDATKAGFGTQVKEAARLFRYYMDTPYLYFVGNNTVLYNPNRSCGSSTVYIENAATEALYHYTPYQPNSPALNNLYGTGDACSAYGNRNFWRLFNDWFGPTATSARIVVMPVDPTTDDTGKSAIVKFRLNQPTTSAVAIPLSLDQASYGTFATPPYLIIQPENWNNPDKNTVVIRGLGGQDQQGSLRYKLITGDPVTTDPQFHLLTGTYVDDVNLTHINTDTSVYRMFNAQTQTHIYTASPTEKIDLTSAGFASEGVGFYSCRSGEVPIYRFRSTNDNSSKLLHQEGSDVTAAMTAGYAYDYPLFAVSIGGSTPVYSLSKGTDTFYTLDASERDAAVSTYGYTYNGIAFTTCAKNQQPIYRLYSPKDEDHLYTVSSIERDIAGGLGYQREGVGFYTCDALNTASIYRLYKGASREHFLTASIQEKTAAQDAGFTYEGVGFSVCTSTSGTTVKRLLNPANNKHFYTFSDGENTYALQQKFIEEAPLYRVSP